MITTLKRLLANSSPDFHWKWFWFSLPLRTVIGLRDVLQIDFCPIQNFWRTWIQRTINLAGMRHGIVFDIFDAYLIFASYFRYISPR